MYPSADTPIQTAKKIMKTATSLMKTATTLIQTATTQQVTGDLTTLYAKAKKPWDM